MASMAGSGSSFESPHNVIHNSVGGSFLGLDLTSFDALLYVLITLDFNTALNTYFYGVVCSTTAISIDWPLCGQHPITIHYRHNRS